MTATTERAPSGMYGETPRVQVGKYLISRQGVNSIWIEHESGEGGEFREDLLEALIDNFYQKFF
jgi:hypothetical protein